MVLRRSQDIFREFRSLDGPSLDGENDSGSRPRATLCL